MEVASIVLSPLLQVFFEKLASGQFADFFKRRKLSPDLLWELNNEFQTFQAVLAYAEDLEDIEPIVKEWLDKLKDVVYDAEDVLDEVATEALRSQLEAEFQTLASKVRKSFSASHNSFVKETEDKINWVLRRLRVLKDGINVHGLNNGSGMASRPLERPTSSLVDESSICGRDDEKAEIVDDLLCSDGERVIAIVGMGGVGKTTLAGLVYRDERVREHFDIFVWVCISDNFNVVLITKKILEDLKTPDIQIQNVNALQEKLKEQLSGKRFLLVLDDDWNKNYALWDELSKPFNSGRQGSKIIVTTREDDVASVMSASIHRPKILEEEYAWSLFKIFAFGEQNPVENGPLEEVGRQIMSKCNGLPLALKTVGALLRSKLDIDYWTAILNSKSWGETHILPTLRISYKYLPSHLKKCFAYCSIFPKDYILKRKKVILLWMAEGLLYESENKTMEQVGDDYFMALISRSLFEKMTKNDDGGDGFIMHDLVNDLATSVSMQFTLRLEGDYSRHTVNKARHMSYVVEEVDCFKKLGIFCKANKLRTLLPLRLSRETRKEYNAQLIFDFYLTKKVQHELLPMLKCLRVLSLSQYKNITELPNSIGEFKHLRFLDISWIGVKELPDSICLLCNLQTLDMSYCWRLDALPRKMWKLINLRHLFLEGTELKEMPMQLGRLKSLQTLSNFIVSKNSGSCIGELRTLTNLQGSLIVSNLQNVKSPVDVGLREKKNLENLELKWYDNDGDVSGLRGKKNLKNLELKWYDNDGDVSERQRRVLDALQPHPNLRSLNITGYCGTGFSNWVGHTSFSNLATIFLYGCRHCESLPPLGQLSSLQRLSIIKFGGVDIVGPEFCGNSSSSPNPFGALKFLMFEDMREWKEWVLFGVFPKLEELKLYDCPKLTGGLPIHPPSLASLYIEDCPQLMPPLPRSIRLLELRNCNKALLNDLPAGLERVEITELDGLESLSEGDLPSSLKSLEIAYCEKLKSLPDGMREVNICLEKLSIRYCPSFLSLPKGGLPSTLKALSIKECYKMESLLEGILNSNICLQDLEIFKCPSLISLPKVGLLSTLKILEIVECDKLESFPEEMMDTNILLEELVISGCSSLISLPKVGLFSALKFLMISSCDKLDSFPEGMVDANIPLEKLFITGCSSLMSFPRNGLPSSLRFLQIWNCKKLELPTHPYHSALEILKLLGCDSVITFSLDSFPKLYEIKIFECCNLQSLMLPENYEHHLAATLVSICSCPRFVSFPNGGLHAPNLTSFHIRDCESIGSLPDNMHELLSSLENLILLKCPKLELFPERGFPSNVKSLEIDYKLVASHIGPGLQNLFFLTRLHISGKSQDVESFLKKEMLPTTLSLLEISSFLKLKFLDKKELQRLSVLERLEIKDCPELKCMPKQGLPASLSILKISRCPLLGKWWRAKEGKARRTVAHVEHIWIDDEFVG